MPVLVRRKGQDQGSSWCGRLRPHDSSRGRVDLVWNKLGVQLAPVPPEQFTRSIVSCMVAWKSSTSSRMACARAGLKKGDILVGLHQWETLSLDNVTYVLNHPELTTFNPLSFFVLRGGQVARQSQSTELSRLKIRADRRRQSPRTLGRQPHESQRPHGRPSADGSYPTSIAKLTPSSRPGRTISPSSSGWSGVWNSTDCLPCVAALVQDWPSSRSRDELGRQWGQPEKSRALTPRKILSRQPLPRPGPAQKDVVRAGTRT